MKINGSILGNNLTIFNQNFANLLLCRPIQDFLNHCRARVRPCACNVLEKSDVARSSSPGICRKDSWNCRRKSLTRTEVAGLGLMHRRCCDNGQHLPSTLGFDVSHLCNAAYDLFDDFLCSRPTVDRSYLTRSENDAASLVFHTIAIVPLRPDRLTLDT